jgi:glycosyltransferase involved in cell wall biosynthesis
MMAVAAPQLLGDDKLQHVLLSTGVSEGPFAEILRQRGFKICHLPFSRSVNFFLEFAMLLRRENISVVHLHTERASFYFGVTALIAQCHVIRSIHACFLFDGRLRFVRMMQRRLLRLLGVRQFAVSKSVAANERIRFLNTTEVIDNWYDETNFRIPSKQEREEARRILQIDEKHFVILSIGNCSKAKNHEAIIRALARMDQPEIIYLHVGIEEVGRPEYRLARSLHVDEAVHFFGMVEGVNNMAWAADVYVQPSFVEGFGIALLEAAACGLPCVATRVGVVSDFPNLCGLAGTTCAPEAVAEAILMFYRMSEASRRAAGLELADCVRNNFSTRKQVTQWVNIYRYPRSRMADSVSPL